MIRMDEMLRRHERWRTGLAGGERAILDAALYAGAQWRGINLYGASMRRIQLTRADLSNSVLDKADLAGACLADANLEHASLGGASLGAADLARANLWGAYLSHASARGSRFAGADLREAVLEDVDFRGASLRGAKLTGARLAGAKFERADLSGVDLAGVNLAGVDISSAYTDDDPVVPSKDGDALPLWDVWSEDNGMGPIVVPAQIPQAAITGWICRVPPRVRAGLSARDARMLAGTSWPYEVEVCVRQRGDDGEPKRYLVRGTIEPAKGRARR